MNILQLTYGSYTAQINLSRGANCISLRNSKYNAKILNEPDYSNLDNPFVYGMPILFPANRISGGEFAFEGRRYKFPVNEPETGCHVHGMLHEMEFVEEQVSKSRVVCSYKADKNNPYLNFPHEFEIKIEYELSDNGLMHSTTIINNSDKNMPYFLGFHTSFNILFTDKTEPEDVVVYADISKEFERGADYLTTGKISEFDEVSYLLSDGKLKAYKTPMSRHYLAGDSGKMVICDKKSNLKVVYENDKKLNYRLIFNGASKGYICLEPQTCLVNCANSPFEREFAGFDYIEPHKSKTFVSQICIMSQ